MRLTFLGKSTQGGGSPTLYATDQDSYVVQGWRVPDSSTNMIEIPSSLLRYLQPETRLAATLHATGKTWEGDGGIWETYTLAGIPVTDADTLAQMNIPDHESCIEVQKVQRGR